MSVNATDIALVAAGGALGCVGRYAMEHIGLFENRMFHTVVINIAGCFLIGIIWTILLHYHANDGWSKFLITGLLGGFTTFSAFSLHPLMMMRDGMYMQSLTYISVSILGGLGACALAMLATDKLLKHL